MKEIMAVIRMDMIGKTKEALSLLGFPALNCTKVMGRGKKKMDYTLVERYISEGIEINSPKIAEAVSEGHRLVPKRLVSIVANNDEVRKIVECIMETNSRGNPGDGKIFVLPVSDCIRIRTAETGEQAI